MKLSPAILSKDQQRAITFLYENDHALLTVPVGFGKTVVSLTAAHELHQSNHIGRFLVIAPLRVCQLTWATEADKWEHLSDVKMAMCIGTEKERIAALEERAVYTVINFENLPWLFKRLGKLHGFDGLIVDELTKLKAVGSAAFKALRPHIKSFKWRVGMTGTLAEEGLKYLYTMAMVVDGGNTFGTQYESFLNRYFVATDYMKYNWVPKDGMAMEIARLIRPFTFRIDDVDYDDSQVPLRFKLVDVRMPDSIRSVYDRMKKDMIVRVNGGFEVAAANAAVAIGKLGQLANGFIYTDEKCDGVELSRYKIDTVINMIDNLTGSRTVVVVYTYSWELARLREAFPDAACLADDPEAVESRWNTGELPVLLLHPKSGGHGLNLQYGGHTVVFCGPIWSRDQFDQVIGRVRRRGQTKPVDVWILCVKESVEDEVMVPRLRDKADGAVLFKRHLLGVGHS